MTPNLVRHSVNEITAPAVGSSGFEVANWVMQQMAPLMEVSQMFAKCGLVPPALANKPEAVLKVLMRGLELGIPMATALDTIHVINGRVALSADDMAGLAMRAGTSFKYDSTPERCIVEWKRGESSGSTSFSVKDAVAAGLTGNPTWKKYPAAMCVARAKAAASRMAAPDMLAGVYTPEEVKGIAKTADYELVDEPSDSGASDVAASNAGTAAPEPPPVKKARTKATAPEIASEKDGEDERVRKALFALTSEMGIQDKVEVNGEKRTVLLLMDDELKGAARMAGCNGKIIPSLFGGADFIVVRDLTTAERMSLGQQFRKLHNERKAAAESKRDVEDAAEVLGGTE